MSAAVLAIRSAEESDLPAVHRIEASSFADPWSLQSFRSTLALERMRFLVAEESLDAPVGGRTGEPQLLGYVIAIVLSDEAEIADLAVAPLARRRGIGGMLLDRIVAESIERGVRTLYLDVRESNVGARALYESRQFLPVGRRRGYYRSPLEDALLLKRELAPR